MNDSKARPSSRLISTAEVYALALRRRSQGLLKPEVPKRSIKASLLPDTAGPDGDYNPSSAPTRWQRLVLSWHEPLTIEDLRDDLNMGLLAAGSPQGAAVYTGEETDMGATVIFSTGAAAIFRTMKIMGTAVDCNQPGEGGVELLCGDEGHEPT